jgi:hypothetical protein
LTANVGQRVHQMAVNPLKPQLEDLKQAHGASPDDQRFGVDGGGHGVKLAKKRPK